MSTYNPNIPTGLINLDTDYINLQNNFQQLDTSYGKDHYKYSDNTADNGKHNVIHIPTPQAASPGTGSLEWAEYTKTVGASVEVFLQRPNIIATGADIQMTINSPPVSAQGGSSFLPGGILLQWGFQGGSSSSSVPVTFPINFTVLGVNTPAYNVQVVAIRQATSPGSDFGTVVVTATTSATGFTIGNIGSHTVDGWFWQAIGPKT